MNHYPPIGFATGVFYKHNLGTKKSLKLLREAGVKAVELDRDIVMPDTDTIETFERGDFDDFEYISLHAPTWEWGHNRETSLIFKKISTLQTLCDLDLVVVHPDTIEDISVFQDCTFPIAFENMDWRKDDFHTVKDMKPLFEIIPSAKMVLDVNHVWTHDTTMQLAHELYEAFHDRITEIHLSGFSKLHDPLFKTKQREIIEAIEDFSVQIIVESQLPLDGVEKERSYIEETIIDVLKQRG